MEETVRDNVVIGYEDGYCIVIDEENKRMKIFCGKERPYEVGTTLTDMDCLGEEKNEG